MPKPWEQKGHSSQSIDEWNLERELIFQAAKSLNKNNRTLTDKRRTITYLSDGCFSCQSREKETTFLYVVHPDTTSIISLSSVADRRKYDDSSGYEIYDGLDQDGHQFKVRVGYQNSEHTTVKWIKNYDELHSSSAAIEKLAKLSFNQLQVLTEEEEDRFIDQYHQASSKAEKEKLEQYWNKMAEAFELAVKCCQVGCEKNPDAQMFAQLKETILKTQNIDEITQLEGRLNIILDDFSWAAKISSIDRNTRFDPGLFSLLKKQIVALTDGKETQGGLEEFRRCCEIFLKDPLISAYYSCSRNSGKFAIVAVQVIQYYIIREDKTSARKNLQEKLKSFAELFKVIKKIYGVPDDSKVDAYIEGLLVKFINNTRDGDQAIDQILNEMQELINHARVCHRESYLPSIRKMVDGECFDKAIIKVPLKNRIRVLTHPSSECRSVVQKGIPDVSRYDMPNRINESIEQEMRKDRFSITSKSHDYIDSQRRLARKEFDKKADLTTIGPNEWESLYAAGAIEETPIGIYVKVPKLDDKNEYDIIILNSYPYARTEHADFYRGVNNDGLLVRLVHNDGPATPHDVLVYGKKCTCETLLPQSTINDYLNELNEASNVEAKANEIRSKINSAHLIADKVEFLCHVRVAGEPLLIWKQAQTLIFDLLALESREEALARAEQYRCLGDTINRIKSELSVDPEHDMVLARQGIDDLQSFIMEGGTAAEISKCDDDLNMIAFGTSTEPENHIPFIRNEIERLRNAYLPSAHKKAEAIVAALNQVPLEDRRRVLTHDSDACRAVQHALAQHRFQFQSAFFKTNESKGTAPDPENSANAYKNAMSKLRPRS